MERCVPTRLAAQGILLELPLASFFLKKLLARGCDLNDLPTLDAELYRSLLLLRDYQGNVEDLALTFTVSNDAFGDNSEARAAATATALQGCAAWLVQHCGHTLPRDYARHLHLLAHRSTHAC